MMKLKSLLTIGSFLLAYAFAYAQPANDDPCNAVVLPVGESCTFQSFTNVAATATPGLGSPACGNYNGGDIWFRFDMPLSGQDVIIDLGENGGITNAAIAVYSGPDCSSLTELACDDNSGISLMPQITMDAGCTNSNGGVTYWIRVWEFENDVFGTFDICTHKALPNTPVIGCGAFLPPANTCCDAVITSLCDINGYCSSSANAFTATATENVPFCAIIENNAWISFVANSEEIELEFVVTNCAFDFGIQAQLFETTDCQNFTIASPCFNPGPGASLDGFLNATGLVPGNTYYLMIDGWASDNCDYTIYVRDLQPEVEVTTNPSTICSGQTTQLNAEVFGTGDYTYSWTPAADLNDPTISNPVASPTVSTTYSVAITGLCEAVTNFEVDVVVDPGAPANLMVDGLGIICDNDLSQSYTLTGNNLVTTLWTVTGGTIVGPSDTNTVDVSWSSAGGTICVDASNGCGAAPQECVVVSIAPEPSISTSSPVTGCVDPGVDLSTLTINDTNGSIGLVTFYANQGAANAGAPELSSSVVTSSGIYWIRKESAPNCFDVTSVVVNLQAPDITITDPAPVCAPNMVDLNSAFISEANALPGTKAFYPTQADAENLTNELASSVVSTAGIYWVRFTTTSGCFDIASITATIDDTPDLSAMETSFCEGVGLDLTTIPYTDANGTVISNELFYDNFTLALTGLPGFALTNTMVQDSGSYYLRVETTAGCSDIVELHAVFGAQPEGSLAGDASLCVGDSVNLMFNLMGNAPFDVEYSDGTSTFTLTGINNGHIEPVEVNSTTTFTLTSVSDGTCDGVITNADVIATVTNSANASITGNATICAGSSTDITFNVDAFGLFDLILFDGIANQTFSNVSDGFVHTVTPTMNTTYTIVDVIDNNFPSCSVNYTGTVVVNVSQAADTSSVQLVCNSTATRYQVVIDITGGDPSSYMVTGGPGTLTGSQFISSFINSGDPYSFVVTDMNNCNSITVSGTHACPCVSDAGLMVGSGGEFCPGDLILITHNNQEILDDDDVFGYILHDNPGTMVGNVVAANSTGAFTFDPTTMIYGTQYYVSPVVANDDGTGMPVLDIAIDPCLSVAAGTPITFLRPSEVVLSGNQTVCVGDVANLTFSYDAPINIDVVISDGTNLDTLTNVGDGSTIPVSPTTNTTYTIVEAITTNPIYCEIDVDGSAAINVSQAADTSSVQIICNNTATQFQVVIDITGGDPATYMVNGDPGTLVGSQFTSAFINSGDAYSFVVTDMNNCNSVNVSGTYSCPCISDAGQMIINGGEYCPGDLILITHNNQEVLDGNDAFGYIMHDNSGTMIGNVVATNNTGAFTFDPATMTYGTQYYISPVVANDDGTGAPVLDIAIDPCLSVAAGEPITFLRPSEVILSGNQTTCVGDVANLTFSYDAPINIDVVISDGTNLDTITNVGDGSTIPVSPTVTTTYTIVEAITTDPIYCEIDVDGSALVNVNTATDTTSVQIICNNTATQYQVVIDITGGDPSSYMVNGDPGTIVGTQFTSGFIQSGTPYSFVVTDANNCNPVTVSGTHLCPCISDAGQMIINGGEYCPGDLILITHNNQEVLDGNDAFGYILHDNPGTTIGNVVATNPTGAFTFDPATMTYGTQYYISPVVANDDGTGAPVLDIMIDACLSVAAGEPITFLRPSEVVISGDQILCAGDVAMLQLDYNAPINIDVVISDGTNLDTLTNLGDGAIFPVSPTSTTTYTIVEAITNNQTYCDIDVAGSAVVTVNALTDTTSVQFVCNSAVTQYQVVIDIAGGDPSSYMVNGDPGTIIGSQFTSAFINSGAGYSFVVTDANNCNPVTVSGVYECPCASFAGEMVISANVICPGDLLIITHDGMEVLDDNDAFGYILHDNPGTVVGNIVATNSTGAFIFDPATMTYGTQYYISAVVADDDGTGAPVLDIAIDECLSVAAGTPVTFLRPSEVELSGNQVLCGGDDGTLTFSYDAPINIDVVISDGTNLDTLTNIGDGASISISPAVSTTYTIVEAITNDPTYCEIDVDGSAVVDVRNSPDTTNFQIMCSNTGTQYQVIFDIVGGDPASYAVNGNPGNIVGNTFTSAFINSGSTYSFELSDVNNCPPIALQGDHDCDCITDAGAMIIDPAIYCDGDLISITHNGMEVLDGNDAFGFVMHDSPTTTLGNIVASNTTGAFTFDPATMTYGTQYYISAVAGNDDGASMPVLDISLDPCLDITAGTPLTFLRSSEVTLMGGETLCNGDTTIFTINYDAPISIDIVISDGNEMLTFSNVTDGEQIEVSPTMSGTYTIISATTTDPTYCPIDISGSAIISTVARAIPDNVQVTCDPTNTQFRVIFNIIGGAPGAYTVSGDPGSLDLATSTFTSDWYPNGSSYTFTVTDGQGCPPFELSGSHACDCETQAGTVSSSDTELCQGEPYLIFYNNDGVIDGNDVLGFVLHDGTSTTIGNPLITNLNGIFNYDPILVLGQTYYVTAVVSNDDGTGFPNLDENLDPCFDASEGLPITFLGSVVAGISAPDSICSNEPIPVTFHFDGTGLYNVEFFDGTSIIVLENLLDGFTQSFNYSENVEFYLQSVSTSTCAGMLDPNATTVNVEVFPTADPVNLEVTCLADTAYIISFDIEGGDESTLTVTGNEGTLTGRTFVSEPILNNTPYSFLIEDATICAPVDIVGIENCDCDPNMAPFISVNSQLTCTNQINGAIEVVHPNNGGIPPYSYVWSVGSSDKGLDNIGPGVYYVTISDATGCSVVDSIEFSAPNPIMAEPLTIMPSCPGEDDGSITFENISGGSGNYTIELDGGFSLSDKEYVGLPTGTYTASIIDDIGCTWEQEIFIDEPEGITLDLGLDTLISIGDSIRLFPVTNGFVDTFMWSQDQLLPCPSCFSQVVFPNNTTVYQLTIVDPNGCQTTDDIIIRVDDERPVYIPNVIHPDGDGLNDMLTVFGGHVVEEIVSLKVFDRWGEQMHTSGGYPPNDENFGWDGRFRGKIVNPNVYVYVIEVRFTDGTTELYKGDVTVIR